MPFLLTVSGHSLAKSEPRCCTRHVSWLRTTRNACRQHCGAHIGSPHGAPLILQWDETFDIAADTGTPVDVRDYQVPFKLTANWTS